ncbi:MAG TPA: PqqD family peptide modification chaperone, partial [Nitrososphaerales archaeon]
HIESLTVDGKPAYVLMKQAEGEYYDVDPSTNIIWNLMDGNRTVKEVFEDAHAVSPDLTEKDVQDVIVSLAEEGTIESTEPEVRKGRVEVISAFQLNVQLVRDSSKRFAKFFKLTRKVIRRPALPISLAVTAVGFALFFTSFVRIFSDPSLLNVAGSALLGFFFYQMVVLLPVYAVHELAHAAMCDYYGGKPGEIGTGLYYLAPFFYCDTSDAWRLSRRARIMISVAGPLSTVVISSLFVFWSYFSVGYIRNVLQISAFFGFYGTLTNFSPVIETDGYYILSDALNIPNLRDEAFSYMKRALLIVFRRPVKTPRQSAKRRRIVAIYTAVTVVWLAFFGYTTVWIMGIYSVSAFHALTSLLLTAIGAVAFDLTALGVNIATLAYFALFVAGFVVMGAVSFQKIRMKGVKLETIHSKKASVFLPLPSDLPASQSSDLFDRSRRLARRYSHFSTVTLQPPFCVAELRLGRVDQSIEGMWEEMGKIEESFRSLHRDFLNRTLGQREPASGAAGPRRALVELAESLPPSERRQALSTVNQHLKKQDEKVGWVLQAAFGTVWTLGMTPDDYKRISRGIFPGLIASDLSITDLPGDLMDFKVHRIVGLDALAKLSSEIEMQSKEVKRRPEVFQTTVFLEPVKSRLVFVGRTDKAEGSVVWLGGLYLYQAWTSYIVEALEEAALGLKAIRLSHPAPMTKTQASKLGDEELSTLKRNLDRVEGLSKAVAGAVEKIESTFQSAVNFHEMLGSIATDESFDVGLYTPILVANEEHLKGVEERVEEFRKEFEWVSRRLGASRDAIGEESERRSSEAVSKPTLAGKVYRSISSLWGQGAARGRTQAQAVEVKLLFAATRLAYDVVIGSDVIL